MGVPVAKTRGMKTGAPGHSISRLRAQATRRGGPQPGQVGAAHPARGRSPLSAMSVPVEVAAARSPTSLATCSSCRCNLAAPNPCRRSTWEVRSRAICHNAIANGIRERAPPRGGASFLFERGLRPTKMPCATSAASIVECATTWRDIAHGGVWGGHNAHPSRARSMKHHAASRSHLACG